VKHEKKRIFFLCFTMEGAPIKKLQIEFKQIPRPSLNFTTDVSKHTVDKFMSAIMKKYAVTEDSLYSKWIFLINDKSIESEFQAKNMSLRKLGILSEPVLIQIYQKEEARQEGRIWNFNAKLRKTMRENEKMFLTELETNGMVSREILSVMGHFQNKLKEIELPLSMEYIHFNMEFENQNSPVHLLNFPVGAKKTLSFSPYLTPGHAALLCLDKKRVCHIDPSCSVSSNNVLILQEHLTNVSYTFINYQLLENEKYKDEMNGGYASGNCAIFTCLNLLRYIVHYEEYKTPIGFNIFWEKLNRVIELSNYESGIKIVKTLFVNLKYMTMTNNGQKKSDYCQSVSFIRNEFDIPENLSELKNEIRGMSSGIDFTSDCVILDLFIVSEMGFQDITKFGNKLREMVKQMTTYGFVNSYCQMFLPQK
jgi:hypothetical protein